MRILITNDDGISAAGISELAAAAAVTAEEIIVAAPMEERSGSSAALVAVETQGVTATREVELAGAPGVRALGVDASPALIVLMACQGSFGAPPDLVLSGINHGPNTGQSVLHSGTVGAAFTAVSHGIPAIAFSHLGTTPESWTTAGSIAGHVTRWAVSARLGAHAVVNVNSPACRPDELRGIRLAHLARVGAAQAQVESADRKQTVTVSPGSEPPDSDSDDALLAANFATVTPVVAPAQQKMDLSRLFDIDIAAFAAEAAGR